MRTPSLSLWAVAAGLAGAGVACLALGSVVLVAWVFDGMDPGTQFSAKVWRAPMSLGVLLIVPMLYTAAWAYTAWCVRMVRSFFVEPEPITLDRGWPPDTAF